MIMLWDAKGRTGEFYMEYIKIVIDAGNKDTDIISADLAEIGIDSVEVRDPSVMTGIIENQDVYGWDYVDEAAATEGGAVPEVILYLSKEEGQDKIRAIEERGYIISQRETVDDSQWKDSYKEHFKAAMLNSRIMVRPSWDGSEPPDGVKILELDPGMAFGTGDHETTSMCAELLEEVGCRGKYVLDIGTGSGILAIAAYMMGAERVLGIDIDPEAVRVARDNGEKNACPSDKVRFLEGDLTEGVDLKADIVTGNLVAEIVMKLAEDMGPCIKSGGTFICSGILSEKKDMVTGRLRELGFHIEDIRERGGWVAIGARYE